MQGRLLSGIADLPAAAWNRLAPPGDPFLSAEYLSALEASRSATTRTGWQPLHLLVEDGAEPVAAAPVRMRRPSSEKTAAMNQPWRCLSVSSGRPVRASRRTAPVSRRRPSGEKARGP
jgi:hypothetical protein